MKLVFSDLDGTLLQAQSYSFEPAAPALAALRSQRTPLVLCTSKTRAEVEFWRERFHNTDPFIVENGGAVYIPKGYFPFAVPGSIKRDAYDVIEFGARYLDLVLDLKEAAAESGTEVLGFHQMSLADVCLRTSLPVRQAELAKLREYDEPFEILGAGAHTLLLAIEARGRHWTRGNLFYHITGENDKATAVRALTKLFRRAFEGVQTIGIGDGHNDAAFLSAMDTPVIVRSRYAVALKRAVPRAEVTNAPGPHGWNEAVLSILDHPPRAREGEPHEARTAV